MFKPTLEFCDPGDMDVMIPPTSFTVTFDDNIWDSLNEDEIYNVIVGLSETAYYLFDIPPVVKCRLRSDPEYNASLIDRLNMKILKQDKVIPKIRSLREL